MFRIFTRRSTRQDAPKQGTILDEGDDPLKSWLDNDPAWQKAWDAITEEDAYRRTQKIRAAGRVIRRLAAIAMQLRKRIPIPVDKKRSNSKRLTVHFRQPEDMPLEAQEIIHEKWLERLTVKIPPKIRLDTHRM